MNRTTYDDLRELAPTDPVDGPGLEVARAAFDRGLRSERADGALAESGRRSSGDQVPRPAWTMGRGLVALTASVLLVGAGAVGAVLIRDIAQPEDVGPQVSVPDPSTSPTPSPSATPDDASAVQCDDTNTSVDGAAEIPSSQWPDLLDHGWTMPDVPVTASPTLQGAPVECAGQFPAVLFADAADDRAVAVYAGRRAPELPAPDTSLAEAEVGTIGKSDRFVEWSDENGHAWYAQAGGISVEAFRTILNDLTFSEDGSVTGPTPKGFEQVQTPEIEPGTTMHLWRMWHNESSPYLWAWWPAAPIEAGITDGRDHEAVEFDGGVALYDPGLSGLSGNPPGLRWEENGVWFWILDSGADLETLKARARSVRPLALDDPQLRPFLDR